MRLLALSLLTLTTSRHLDSRSSLRKTHQIPLRRYYYRESRDLPPYPVLLEGGRNQFVVDVGHLSLLVSLFDFQDAGPRQ